MLRAFMYDQYHQNHLPVSVLSSGQNDNVEPEREQLDFMKAVI